MEPAETPPRTSAPAPHTATTCVAQSLAPLRTSAGVRPQNRRPVGNPKVVDGASVFVVRAQQRSARSGQAQVRAYTIIYRTRTKEEGTHEAPHGHKCEGRRHARSAPRAQVPGESARRATTPRRRRPLIGSPVRPTPRGQRLRAPPPRPRWPCGATPAPTPPWASDAAHAAAPRR